MSADLTRKQFRQGSNGQTILPQPVSNPSIIESVAGFIHEVVPQAYSSVLPGETRENIIWARFEVTDYNDPENYSQVSECESESTPPLLLFLGYSTGVQVWSINGGGDATELLSWSQGAVRTLRLLDRPKDGLDLFSNKRPLVAVVDSSGAGPQFCTVNFVSLRTAEVIKSIKFKTPICDIVCNKKSVVITFSEKIAVFDVGTLEDRLTVTTCYPSPGSCINPVAIGSRWLAYAEKRLTTWQRSSGGCETDGSQSYTSTVIHAAKSLSKGLRDLSGSLTGGSQSATNNNAVHPGIVTVIDIEMKPTKEDDPENLICHFVGHVGPIVAMTFDPSGMLLVTADKHGHRFHVYRIQPHPCCVQLASVHHLYILHRGETTARVQDITVSLDSRWVAVSSVRGTTHVFPITPYGGPVTVRTHTTPHVVNRLSRFERSAGLSDGRGSPLPEVPSQPSTPRLPPYPVPCVLLPLAQIRRTDESPLAATFATPRAWIPGQTSRQNSKRSLLDSLFVISSGGSLIQYDLEPKPIPGVVKDKISYDTGIELGVDAKAEWPLLKPPYSSTLQPPLPSGNPLLSTTSFEHTTDPRTIDDRWMSQVEIVTHTGPHRRLWMGPQFSFKSIDPLTTSGLEINAQNDNTKPTRSNPVNMPHRPFLLVESGSAGSVESPHLTDYGSSTEDVQHGESRLREDLADAMQETVSNSSGVLVGTSSGGVTISGGSSSIGRLRAAILERQVNPLGTVITLPFGGSVSNQDILHQQITSERRQHQLYHQVLPVSYMKGVCLLEDSCGDVLKTVTSMKTTCVQVQTLPLDIMNKSKTLGSTTLTKSIQTTTALGEKKSKIEQKVKGKSKKKSITVAEDIGVSVGEMVLEKQDLKSNMEIGEKKISGKCNKSIGDYTMDCGSSGESDSKMELAIGKKSGTKPKVQQEVTVVETESVSEVVEEKFEEDDIDILISPLTSPKKEQCSISNVISECEEEMIVFGSLLDNNDTNDPVSDKIQGDESIKDLEIDLLTGNCQTSNEIEDNIEIAELNLNDEKVLNVQTDLFNDRADELIQDIDVNKIMVDTTNNDRIDLVSSLEKSNDSNRKLLENISSSDILDYDIESGESSSQKEESSVTGNDDIITDSSDDKKNKKELTRKVRVQELELTSKDNNEIKKQTSPSKVDGKDDTESSDEPNSKASDSRSNSLKLIKRKKSGKKMAEHTTDECSSIIMETAIKLKSKCHSVGTLDIEKSDYETCSEKKSDSSVESFPEYKKKSNTINDQINYSNFTETKSWSSIVKNIEKEPIRPSNSAEDRDSVYESCNDEDFPLLEILPTTSEHNNSITFNNTNKEIFEEIKPIDIQTKLESGSSNAEEKTDSGEKDMFTSIKNLKKVKKQKKRKR